MYELNKNIQTKSRFLNRIALFCILFINFWDNKTLLFLSRKSLSFI